MSSTINVESEDRPHRSGSYIADVSAGRAMNVPAMVALARYVMVVVPDRISVMKKLTRSP